jgi:hypothetical protein
VNAGCVFDPSRHDIGGGIDWIYADGLTGKCEAEALQVTTADVAVWSGRARSGICSWPNGVVEHRTRRLEGTSSGKH